MTLRKRLWSAIAVRIDRIRHQARSRREAPHMVLARRGEDLAHRYAEQRLGWLVIGRNYHDLNRRGDIDLIALERQTLVIVEVKTRSAETVSHPLRAVDEEKGRRIGHLARTWIRKAELAQLSIRFDAITVVMSDPPAIEHHPDIFYPTGRPAIESRGANL